MTIKNKKRLGTSHNKVGTRRGRGSGCIDGEVVF